MGNRTPTSEMPARKAGGRACSAQQCNRPYAKGGYCDLHYQRIRKTGTLDEKPRTAWKRPAQSRPRAVRLCEIPGCERKHCGNGFCELHLQRFKRHGDPTFKRPLNRELVCEIEDCGRPVVGAGLCVRHSLRKYRNGSPLIVMRETAAGQPERWLREHIGYAGEGCLTWPFSITTAGYGQINGPDAKGAHRQMCIWAHGPPPSSVHEAAHRCGKGHQACVHPQHLSWKLPVENSADKVGHGTILRGSQNPVSKLTEAQVLQIFTDPRSQHDIAAAMGVPQQAVSKIKRRERWAWLTDGLDPTKPNPRPSGSSNGNAKLTAQKALDIFRASGTHAAIAKSFGVSRRTVLDIKSRRTWSAVTNI